MKDLGQDFLTVLRLCALGLSVLMVLAGRG